MSTLTSTDVLILGGGPAGTATALMLARLGRSVVVLERTEYVGTRIGETLPPGAVPILHQLGIWEAFSRTEHLPSPGIVSAWETSEPYENDFIFNPYGNGWHLDRVRFDAMLAHEAKRAGAEVLTRCVPTVCNVTEDGRRRITVDSPHGVKEFTARYIVDATGRSSWFASRHGATRLDEDHLIGLIGFGPNEGGLDARTFLEATEHGWWYSARLPGQRAVAAYMTDSDFLPRGREVQRAFWIDQLQQTSLTRTVFGDAPPEELRTVNAAGGRISPVCAGDWLAVGDAASTFDPLSSQGIVKALQSGIRAAEAVVRSLDGAGEAFSDYETWIRDSFAEYLRMRRYYYGQVTRWPGSAFWGRRLGAVE